MGIIFNSNDECENRNNFAFTYSVVSSPNFFPIRHLCPGNTMFRCIRVCQNQKVVAGTCRPLITASVSRMWLRSSVRFSTPVNGGSRSSSVSQRHRQKSSAPTTSAVSARWTPRWCTGKPSTWRRAWTMSSSTVACLFGPHPTAAAAARTHLPIFTCGHHLPSTLNVSWNH